MEYGKRCCSIGAKSHGLVDRNCKSERLVKVMHGTRGKAGAVRGVTGSRISG